ncbi:MAG: hypothetical protein IPP78_02965 [Holophagaceae bacterium]|nr:hypothetical protein [Holophagaceae bacterium]
MGQSASFAVSASGNPIPAFQWERSSDGNNWSSISGATGATFNFTPAKGDHAAQFRAKASNVAGTAASNAATLAVQWAPAFTLQPTAQVVSSPNPATFNVLADANPAAAYQWQTSFNGTQWTDQAGSIGTSFQTGPTSNTMNNLQFRCTATNVVGSATSNTATLLVNVPTFTLTVNLGTGTTGSPAATTAIAAGTVVNYAYTPQPGFTSLQVLLDGSPVSASGTVAMNGAHTLAVTASVIQRRVTFTAGSGGDVAGFTDQTVANGGSTTPVTAIPDSGFSFVNWTGNGFTASSSNPLTLNNVSQDYALTANFSAVPPVFFALGVNLGNGVAGTPTNGGSFVQGSVVPYSYAAQAGFNNLAVLLDGSPVAAAGSITMNAAHSLVATAQAIPASNTIQVGQGGLMFVPSSLTVQVGMTVTFHWASSGHSMVLGNPCTPSGQLDSGVQSAGFEITFTPVAAGDVHFFCQPHCGLGMTGVIHVNP